ncbi:Signal transduction histidine kinase [Streptomyces aidingensis]|uniref:histidine kinase n=1 Tax=Streptomyces aidingensis TaxID=910347 RepID=A0A1I1U8S2_9ACTN|nr:Signal transduction histidine kinase [Streptomyces aidingensis]
MRSRLLLLLTVLLAGLLLALGVPLAASQAAREQQRVVVDRIDDTARFASLAQFAAAPGGGSAGGAQAQLQDELNRYYDLYGIRAGVFDRNGLAIAQAPADWRMAPDGAAARAFDSAFAEALAGRRSQGLGQIWPWDTDARLVIASPVTKDGDVVAVVLTDSPTGPMRARVLRGWLPVAAAEAAAMLLAVAAAHAMTRWVLRPVRVLDRTAHAISTGQLNSRVATAGGPPELRRLARSFNEMADHVEQVLEQQRAFVADASHQLRNPLAALLLRIELLGLELPGGHREFESVRAEGRRLAQVLDGLLDLALAEHSPADPRLTDIAALVAERIAAWRPVAERRSITLAAAGPAAVTGWADPVATSSALDALIDNALKFTADTGEGRVTVAVAAEGEWTRIRVTDNGPGLTDEELARIGDRFWRSGRHQNVSGSGLGLSIVGALLAAGGGKLDYAHHPPHGLSVTVSVPRAEPGTAPAADRPRAAALAASLASSPEGTGPGEPADPGAARGTGDGGAGAGIRAAGRRSLFRPPFRPRRPRPDDPPLAPSPGSPPAGSAQDLTER